MRFAPGEADAADEGVASHPNPSLAAPEVVAAPTAGGPSSSRHRNVSPAWLTRALEADGEPVYGRAAGLRYFLAARVGLRALQDPRCGGRARPAATRCAPTVQISNTN